MRTLAAAAIVLLAARMGQATSIRRLSFEDMVPHPDRVVARVHLTDREPVTFELDGREEVCGYRYRADVVEALRAPSGSVVFFSEDGAATPGEDRLLIGMRVSMEQRRIEVERDADAGSPGWRALWTCRELAEELWVVGGARMFMLFDEPARIAIGEDEWLRAPSASDPDGRPRLPGVEVTGPSGTYTVLRWSDVRTLVLEPLSRDESRPLAP